MHDVNGKAVHVGDRVNTNAFGICRIVAVVDEDNEAQHGANVLLRRSNGEEFNMRLHVGGAVRVPTMKELAARAYGVQDACNLSGVLHSFSRDITDLRLLLNEELGKEFSTAALNQHPVCVLYSSKIASLTLSEVDGVFGAAYNWAEAQAK